MRIDRRIGLLLGLAVSVAGTSARGQVGGTAAGTPVGGAGTQVGADSNGGLSAAALGDNTPKDPTATTVAPPRPSRVSPFNRVTTARRGGASSPSPASVAGTRSQAAPMGPYSVQAAAQARAKVAQGGVPSSSTWQQTTQRPVSAPSTGQTTARSYYPGMRPGQQLNANTPQAARAGQRRTGMSAGMLSGLGANAAKVARPGPTTRPGQPATSGAAPRR
jgi:hypothetical protein